MYALWDPLMSLLRAVLPLRSRDMGPKTPEEAAEALVAALSPVSRQTLAHAQPEDLRNYDQPLGNYCRDVLGLDGRNEDLIKACRSSDADGAVRLIVRMAWARAKKN